MDRAGWAAAQVHEGKFVAGMYGTLPGDEQSVPRAELYALRAVLGLVLPPATIWMDHENHVRAIRKGKAWCTSPVRLHADLWKVIWEKFEDIGGLGESLVVKYTPAHTKEVQGEPLITRHNRIGNSWADKLAKCGRDLHVMPKGLIERIAELRGVALTYARWVGRAAALQGKDGRARDANPRSDEEA